MDILENEGSVVVLNDQPEFSTEINEKYSANYFILCEEDESHENFYESKVAGMTLLDWVSRACENKPTVIKIARGDDALSVVKPYLGDAEFSVVLYASTPLVTQRHLNDLLGFVGRKRMNACKLRKGYVFRNEYIAGVDEIYSIDTYDFASSDFFEVKSAEDLSFVQNILFEKVVAYHRRNGVYFENSGLATIDANTNIGTGSKIASGTALLNNSVLGENNIIAENVIVSGSKLGDNVVLYPGAKVIDSVVKSGTIISENAVIKKSVIGEGTKVGVGSVIVGSGVKNDSEIQSGVLLDNARIAENVVISKGTKILGETEPAVVLANSYIGAGATVIGVKIAEGSRVNSGAIISNKVGI